MVPAQVRQEENNQVSAQPIILGHWPNGTDGRTNGTKRKAQRKPATRGSAKNDVANIHVRRNYTRRFWRSRDFLRMRVRREAGTRGEKTESCQSKTQNLVSHNFSQLVETRSRSSKNLRPRTPCHLEDTSTVKRLKKIWFLTPLITVESDEPGS